MAAQLGNYVLETATSPGTGVFTLNGAEANRRPFSAAFPNGGNVLYFADDSSQAEWGIGTLTIGKPSTLARSTVLGNTAGTKVALNFPGSVEVYNEIPAEMVPVLEQDGSLELAGNLTVKGKAIVQNVDDFTSQEAVPAKQADKRYVRNNAATKGGIVALDLDGRGTGDLSYQRADGSWATCQPKGDYATNEAVRAEQRAREDAVSGLDRAKLNVSGGTINGTLKILAGSGYWQFGGEGYAFVFRNHNAPGAGIIDFNSMWGRPNNNVARISSDGSFDVFGGGDIRVRGNPVALRSDLPLDANQRIQSFSVSIADGGRITFPVAFSGEPTSIQLQCMQTNSRMTVANPASSPQAWGIPSVGVQIVAGDHTRSVAAPITVWVTAIGPK